MSEENKTKVVLIVRYKSNGVDPSGWHNSPIKPGIAGRFTCDDVEEEGALAEAEKLAKAAVVKCKKFFNERTTVKVEHEDEDGELLEKPKEVKTIVTKEVVHVWIDRYEDGRRVHNGDPTCDRQSESKAAEIQKQDSSSPPKSTSLAKEPALSK